MIYLKPIDYFYNLHEKYEKNVKNLSDDYCKYPIFNMILCIVHTKWSGGFKIDPKAYTF